MDQNGRKPQKEEYSYLQFAIRVFVSFQKALNDINSEFDWAKKIQAKMLDKEFPLNINLKLLCGADLIESFAVPGLWKDEDVG